MSWLKNKLNKRVLVDAKLTPTDWQLYKMPEVERVAEALNKRFNETVNMHATRQETDRAMRQELRLYRNWGSNDDEPHYVLEDLLNEVYDNA